MMCCGTVAQLFAEGADSAAAPAAEPAAAPAPAPKPAGPQGSVYGKVYADYYYDVSDTPIVEKSQIELSRVYLGYKEKIDDHFTADVLLDVARLSTATSATGTLIPLPHGRYKAHVDGEHSVLRLPENRLSGMERRPSHDHAFGWSNTVFRFRCPGKFLGTPVSLQNTHGQ